MGCRLATAAGGFVATAVAELEPRVNLTMAQPNLTADHEPIDGELAGVEHPIHRRPMDAEQLGHLRHAKQLLGLRSRRRCWAPSGDRGASVYQLPHTR